MFLTIALSALVLCSCASETDGVMTESMNDFAYDYGYDYDVSTPPSPYVDDYKTAPMAPGVENGYGFEVKYSYEEDVTAESDADIAQISDKVVTRKIIYSSSYDIETKEFEKSVNSLKMLCDKYDAYMEKANTYAVSGSARMAYYTIRVPVENYDAFTNDADSIGVVTSSSQDNKDVTENYYDTEARLESAKIREERVLEILKNSSKLDDVLALEQELADIRYEIETYMGTLRKYDSLVSYATVNVNISEVEEYVEPKQETVTFNERMKSSFDDGINEFNEGWQNFLVALSYNFIPLIIWLVIIIIVVIVLKVVIKKIKRTISEWEKKEYDHGEAHSETEAKTTEDAKADNKTEKDGE